MRAFEIFLNLAAYALTAAGLLFWAYVTFRIVRYPENHVGWNILFSLGLFVVLAAVSFAGYYFSRSALAAALGVFAVISVAAVFVIYHFNILIPYEVWLKRGMPPRPF